MRAAIRASARVSVHLPAVLTPIGTSQAQEIEMQRRARRPFERIKIIGRQQASYVAIETCNDRKAAVLTLLVRLPGNPKMGTGLCFGSTLVNSLK